MERNVGGPQRVADTDGYKGGQTPNLSIIQAIPVLNNHTQKIYQNYHT